MSNRPPHDCKGRTSRRRKERRASFQLRVEQLEHRRLLTGFTVTSWADTGDANPGDGLAQDISGQTTLRAAIEESNALAGPNAVDFDLGPSATTITLQNGELAITDDLIIEGPGAKRLAVSGDYASRVFSVTDAEVMISGLTVTHGAALQGGGIANFGGALTIADSVLSDNQAIGGDGTSSTPGQPANGGAFLNLGVAHISNSVFSDNRAEGGDGGDGTRAGNAAGGAIANRFGAVLTIYDSKFFGTMTSSGRRQGSSEVSSGMS